MAFWVFHTEAEWRMEMGQVSRRRHRTALNRLKALKIIEVRTFLNGNLTKTHVRMIDPKMLDKTEPLSDSADNGMSEQSNNPLPQLLGQPYIRRRTQEKN
jgi:hypothetical protein